jgi:hypothetical protein
MSEAVSITSQRAPLLHFVTQPSWLGRLVHDAPWFSIIARRNSGAKDAPRD